MIRDFGSFFEFGFRNCRSDDNDKTLSIALVEAMSSGQSGERLDGRRYWLGKVCTLEDRFLSVGELLRRKYDRRRDGIPDPTIRAEQLLDVGVLPEEADHHRS